MLEPSAQGILNSASAPSSAEAEYAANATVLDHGVSSFGDVPQFDDDEPVVDAEPKIKRTGPVPSVQRGDPPGPSCTTVEPSVVAQ